MPRIVPIQLLRCLKVLLNQNGGILSLAEVQRISCLMTKYSKKLVSKCIYVQILKCTATDLLDEFMRVGGWQLVFIWLNDGIRLANWPLVQEIIELLLLCPVDVNRLKMNSAPKTIKGLSNNGGNEAVRILADRLVKQWLKVVTEGNELARAAATNNANTDTTAVTTTNSATIQTPATAESQATPTVKIVKSEKPIKNDPEEDPLYVPETFNATAQLKPSPAQQKGIKSGLVFKIVVKDGQQLLSKVETKPTIAGEDDSVDTNDDDGASSDMVDGDETNVEQDDNANAGSATANILEDDSTSFDKIDIKDSGESSSESMSTNKAQKERKSSISSDTKTDAQDQRKSKDSTKSSSSSKEHKSDKDKDRKSSSSSHRSSSSTSHKSSSKSSSSSSSSKPKSSSSSSSSSHRSSSDKHRSSSSGSSSKDKSSSSSSKHKSSSKSSSSSSSSSSKDRHRDKEREKSSSSSSTSSSANKKDKEREKDLQQAEKDKDTLAKMLPPSLDKLGKIPKKPRLDDKEDSLGAQANSSSVSQKQPTSIIIPSKKASISIEIRRDAEKSSAVKTYKSQFRSHGLTEEAPPPPSRKTLKKPGAAAIGSGNALPTSLPSSSLKRSSPPPSKDTTTASSASPSTAAASVGGPPSEKKQKIDINSIVPAAATAAEKPGAIKLIPPKRIQTLVETNLFSDALSAATGPKKVNKRKRSNASGKDEPTTPTSPDAPKVAPLKFYQDTLDESAKAAAAAAGDDKTKTDNADDHDVSIDKDGNDTISLDDDDDIPLKKVKEDIEKRVRNQKKDDDEAAAGAESEAAIVLSDNEEHNCERDAENASPSGVEEARKPGPGCGPDGPPGVLMLHRRKGPKKKLTWRPQESLEQIRYFEMDENERCNVMKVSFLDMKNMERFNERTSLTNMTKRGPRPGDMQEPRTEWRPLIEVDDVPEHPHGAQSKERKVQADREMTTLRALYFSPNMIPDSPSEAELEPHSSMDPPTIPLDDITGNPDAVNDFTDMPWPEPKGTPRNNETAGTGGLGSLGNAADMFGVLNAATVPPAKTAAVAVGAGPMSPTNPFSNFMNPFGGNPPPGMVAPNNMMNNGPPMQMMPPNVWQNGGGPPRMPNGNMMNGNPFQGPPNPSDMMMGGGGPQRHNFMGQPNGPPGGFNGPPQRQFMGPGNAPPFGPPGFGPNGPNFGPMGPGGPPMGPNGPLMMNNMGPIPPQMNNMGPIPPQMNNMGPVPPQMNSMNHGPNNRNNINWTHGNSRKRDHNDSWRHGGGSGNNNGVCKAYMRGNCSVKNCKYLHPKSRR